VLRALIPSIYAPTVLEAAGEAALLPVIPLLARHLGFSVPAAAALAMIAGLGAVLGPIPTGRLMMRVGARRAIIASGLALAVSNVVALVVVGDGLQGHAGPGHRLALVIALIVMAATGQVWQLGRQSFLGTELPPELRARGMTTFGGMLRIGQVIGPLLGAVVVSLGHDAWVFGLFAVMTTSATIMVAVFMVPGETAGAAADETAREDAERALDEEVEKVAEASAPAPDLAEQDRSRDGRTVLARMVRVGLGVTPIMMGRINRPLIVPLLGDALALDASTISVIFGIAAVLEIVMFIPAGSIMDRRGRAAVAVPCSLIMGVGYVLLSVLAPTIGTRSPGWALVALLAPCLLIAVGNGLGSGIVMTLGIDVSPERGRTRYLSWWNTVIGVGRLTAPLLVAGIALVAPVAVAGVVSGVLCLAGSGWLARVLPGVVPGRDRA